MAKHPDAIRPQRVLNTAKKLFESLPDDVYNGDECQICIDNIDDLITRLNIIGLTYITSDGSNNGMKK